MNFPLIERRIATNERRAHSPDRRHEQNSDSFLDDRRNNNERRNKIDRRVLKLDRETLLTLASLIQFKNQGSEEKKSKSFLFCSTFLLPLTVAAVSVFATISINKQQVASAEQLAVSQQVNAQKIAASNMRTSETIAEGEMETEHLKHLVAIFSSIISPNKNDTYEIIHQRIRSLAVYDDEALPFLLQIRHHYSNLNKLSLEGKAFSTMTDEEKKYSENTKIEEKKAEVARITIQTIIKDSQINVSGQIIEGTLKNRLNLRNKEFENYNLDRSSFTNVNLYKANFSNSSLQHSFFTNADLVEADFKNANLTGVTFQNVTLRKTDFHQANLKEVKFVQCKNIEDAKFSLNTVLFSKSGFFGEMTEEQYILILMAHKEELVRISNNEEEKSKLNNILTILQQFQIYSFPELQKKFHEYKSKNYASIKNKTNKEDQISMSFINELFQ